MTFDGSRTSTLADVFGAVDQLHALRRLAGGAVDLLVACVADQQDVVVVTCVALHFLVHLGHQGAGRVDGAQFAVHGLLADCGGHSVRGEHDHRAFGHLVGLVDEDRAAFGQPVDDVAVVHDLLAHVDRGAVGVQGLLDGHHGPVDARAVAAWFGHAATRSRSTCPLWCRCWRCRRGRCVRSRSPGSKPSCACVRPTAMVAPRVSHIT